MRSATCMSPGLRSPGPLDGRSADDEGVPDAAFRHPALYWLKGVIDTCAHIGP